MTNYSRRGYAIEALAVDVLRDLGYVVHRSIRSSSKRGGFWMSHSNDIWGCIDIVAKRRGERMRYIQVTTEKGIGEKKRDLGAVPWDVHLESVEIWKWIHGSKSSTKGPNRGRTFLMYSLDEAYAVARVLGPFSVAEAKALKEKNRASRPGTA